MNILKVALTGGPCGGKTTSIQLIEKEFTEKGYSVIIVPEAATILIESGIKPFGDHPIDIVDFQRMVMDLQLKFEELAEVAAKKKNNDTIILMDRGIIDDRAYITGCEFNQLLKERKLDELSVLSRYDLVLHLKSVACGKEEFYTLDNNTARTETPEQARYKDKKTLNAWLGHDNLKIIGNDTDFEGKKNRVIHEIYKVLDKPYPLQIQKKYLVNNINLDKLKGEKFVKLDIEQYALNEENKDIIYRKTTKGNKSKYTIKVKIDTGINNERIVTERKISEEEYYESIPLNMHPIKKRRYCFAYKNEYFRLDLFEDKLAVLEIEQTDKTKDIEIPKFIDINSEITDDVNYRNSMLFDSLNKNKVYKKV